MKARSILFLALFSLIGGCSHECHVPADTRCDGDVAEICDTDGHWDPFTDCRTIGWVCRVTFLGSTCVPPTEDAATTDAAPPDPMTIDGGHS